MPDPVIGAGRSGTCTSSTSSVIAIAKTPSARVSTRRDSIGASGQGIEGRNLTAELRDAARYWLKDIP